MSYLLGHAARCSFTNPLKTSYKLSRHYSVLCSYKTNNLNDHFLNRKYYLSNQSIQTRNFSFEGLITGYFRMYVGLADSALGNFFIEQLLNVHDLGLPWWATISLTCAAFRIVVMFPVATASEKELTDISNNYSKLKNVSSTVEKDLRVQAIKNNWTQNRLLQEIEMQKKKETKKVKKEFYHYLKWYRIAVGIIVQIGLWTFVSVCLRKIWALAAISTDLTSEVLKYELSNEGVLWFKNLLEPDKFGIPILLGIVSLVTTEFFDLKRGTKTVWLTWIFRSACVAFAIFSAYMPSNVTLFWLVSSCAALVQNLVLLSPRFRKFARLPPSPIDPHHPYRVIRERFRIKWGF